MIDTLTRYEKRVKRLEIIQQIEEVERQFCEGCPFREQYVPKCPTCPHLEHFLPFGDELDKLCTGYQPIKQGVGELKHDTSKITKAAYVKYKRKGLRDSDIAEKYEVSANALNLWKRKNKVSKLDWQ